MKKHNTPAWILNTPARSKPNRIETLILILFLLHLAALAVILAVVK